MQEITREKTKGWGGPRGTGGGMVLSLRKGTPKGHVTFPLSSHIDIGDISTFRRCSLLQIQRLWVQILFPINEKATIKNHLSEK